jgi:hypothetical protein
MTWMRQKALVLAAATVALAALLGGSLGLATALHTTSLSAGFNLVGGPFGGEVTPAKFTSCLGTSWNAVYIWDAANQQWHHHFRTAPDYVNGANVGGIQTIPQLAGVALLMNTAVANAALPDAESDTCS